MGCKPHHGFIHTIKGTAQRQRVLPPKWVLAYSNRAKVSITLLALFRDEAQTGPVGHTHSGGPIQGRRVPRGAACPPPARSCLPPGARRSAHADPGAEASLRGSGLAIAGAARALAAAAARGGEGGRLPPRCGPTCCRVGRGTRRGRRAGDGWPVRRPARGRECTSERASAQAPSGGYHQAAGARRTQLATFRF